MPQAGMVPVTAPAPQESGGASAVEQVLVLAREAKGDPTRFTSYKGRPVEFATDILGVWLWPKQQEILEKSVRRRRVAIRSGHNVGKTFVMAVLALYWLYAEQGRVITTASTWEQVEDALWGEIITLWRNAKVTLPGQQYATELKISDVWYAKGLATNKASAFQGRHHPRLLVIIDEAAGVEAQIHTEASTIASGEFNHIVMVGNPTETSGDFYDSFKHPEIWETVHISCFDHPNIVERREVIPGAVSWAWVEERRAMWGEGHPFWFSRVLGQFPRISEKGVIPLMWAERAQEQEARRLAELKLAKEGDEQHPRLKPILALDVARYGMNRCVLGVRWGDVVEEIEAWDHVSTMETAGRAAKKAREIGASHLVVDESGVGGGVVDRLMELDLGETQVVGYNSGHRAWTPGLYSNRRSELWWLVRKRLENDRLLYPVEPQLIADLVAPTYRVSSSGRIQVETKEALLERGVKSPDYADMLVMLFADSSPEQFEQELKPEPAQDPAAFEAEHGLAEESSATIGGLPAGF